MGGDEERGAAGGDEECTRRRAAGSTEDAAQQSSADFCKELEQHNGVDVAAALHQLQVKRSLDGAPVRTRAHASRPRPARFVRASAASAVGHFADHEGLRSSRLQTRDCADHMA